MRSQVLLLRGMFSALQRALVPNLQIGNALGLRISDSSTSLEIRSVAGFRSFRNGVSRISAFPIRDWERARARRCALNTYLLSLALLLSATFTLRAGMVVVQRMESGGQTGEMTIKIQGDKIRADVSPALSMITDMASGSVTTLMHPQKVTLQMSVAAAAQLLDHVKSQGEPVQSDPSAKLRPTGKHEAVNGIATDVFTTEIGPVTTTYWIAKDYPNAAKILDTLKRIQNSAMGMLAKGVIGQVTEFPGVPLKTEMQLSPKQKVTATILSVTEQPLPDSDFVPPADYKPLPSPMFSPPSRRLP